MNEDSGCPPEMDPSRYIEKVSLVTGEVLDQPIYPRQLLVHNHRDYHVVDVHARHMMSRVVRVTGSEEEARRRMKEMRRFGHRASEVIAKAIGESDVTKVSKSLFGLKEKEYFFRYKRRPYSDAVAENTIAEMRSEVSRRLEQNRQGDCLGLRVLLTGATGFVGKEILWQVASDSDIQEVVAVIRPKTIRDRKTGDVLKVLSPADRGEKLLERLWIESPEIRAKFRFIEGDVEKPNLGIEAAETERVGRTVTHLIHCAASVAFDDPYEKSFSANVIGTLNALRFSSGLQSVEDSPFIAHIGIETSYIHGRQIKEMAREDEVVFPRNFYNNYYELTKAMGSIETERFMLDKGLRVAQLCPAIVIGEAVGGNNRGDTKVVNAPVNLFGRAGQAISNRTGSWIDRSKGSILARMASIFPGDPSAQINLIPVDRVAAGIVASVKQPEAIGERVHLATDRRITASEMVKILNEELGANVKLAEPTLHRTVTLPAISKLLHAAKQQKIANVLGKLGSIFGGYSEWGQPIHEVGNDVRILGLEEPRPDSRYAFRMLCRHNRFVQNFGQIKDLDEISRRERIWMDFVVALEEEASIEAGAMPPYEFQKAVFSTFDLEGFTRKDRESGSRSSLGAEAN